MSRGDVSPVGEQIFDISSYIDQAIAGHSSKTHKLANVLLHADQYHDWPDQYLFRDKLAQLRREVDHERGATGRHQAVRNWLHSNRAATIQSWAFVYGPPLTRMADADVKGGTLSMTYPPRSPPSMTRGLSTTQCSMPMSAGRRPRLPEKLVIDSDDYPVHREYVPSPAYTPPLQPSTSILEEYNSGNRGVPPGVVVFDFDKTLTTKHVGMFDLNDTQKRAFGGAARLSMIRDLLQQLHAMLFVVCVVTRNSSHAVKQALTLVGCSPFVHAVYGFEQYNDNCPKSQVIGEQVLKPLELSGASLLFVDDDRRNVEEVRTSCPGCEALHVKQRSGLVEAECQAIFAWAQNKRRGGGGGRSSRAESKSSSQSHAGAKSAKLAKSNSPPTILRRSQSSLN